MKKLTKVVITGISLLSVGALQAQQQSYLYKDHRIMAMGGANVAAGGYSTSIFSNPAGIAKVSNEHGMVIELLGVQGGISSDSEDLINDLTDAIDTENTDDIISVLEDYSGQTVHVDVSNYSSMTNNHGKFAWSLGLLSATEINATPHANSNGLLAVQGRGYGGLTGAASYTFQPTELGDLSIGLGLKFISQQSYEGLLEPQDLIDMDNLDETLRDKFEDDGSAFGADLGAIYQFNTYMKPSFGVSVLNIGDMDFNGSYGSQPMTVNLGASIQPDLIFAKKTIIALDYMDLLNANKFRYYNPDNGNGQEFTEGDDTDIIKRIRFGASTMLYENTWSSFTLAGGIYQGNYTAGFTFVASILQIGFTTFEEELGPEAGDYGDRRYNLSAGIVW